MASSNASGKRFPSVVDNPMAGVADEPAAGVLHALQAPPAEIRASVLAKLRKAS